MLLEAEGLWPQTVAVVRLALLQRLLTTKAHQTMSQLWTRPNGLKMDDVPCPVTDEEAAEWLAARRLAA